MSGAEGVDRAGAAQPVGKGGPFLENVAESATACLLTMVQGNVLALTLTHWLVASRTGLLAGAAAWLALLLLRNRKLWVVSAALGLATFAADLVVHPGGFGPVALEAVVTGAAAALLAALVHVLKRSASRRRETLRRSDA